MNNPNRRPSDTESQLDEINLDTERRKSVPTFKRLISTESTISSIRLSLFDLNAQQQTHQKYSLCSVEFLVKLVQLVIAIASIGLYSSSMHVMKDSEESVIFPNVVYGAFIIISTVVVLSYLLGHLMPPIILRIFLLLGVTLYFVAGCVTLYEWYKYGRENPDVSSGNMLISDALLNILNSALYACDLYLSVKKSLTA